MFYAHSLSDEPETTWQTLDEHHRGVSALASSFADFGIAGTAGLLGGIHDVGKRSDSFQNRLRGKGGKVDHTAAACLYLLEQWQSGSHAPLGKIFAELLAYPLLGHHGGMPDYGSQSEEGTLLYRITGKRVQAVPDWKKEGLPPLSDFMNVVQEINPFMIQNGRLDAFAAAFLLRMLHSCLVDADFLDTEHFCSPDRHGLRPVPPDMDTLEKELLRQLSEKGFLPAVPVNEAELSADTPCGSEERRVAIRKARIFMLRCCLSAAEESPGLFSLTMPTGGGKTLSSLAFALRHARIHGLRRVILVVPYTSIIEQNADIIRKMLGEDTVFEHHSHYVHPDEKDGSGDESAGLTYKLSSENWDAAVIVTTSVQFFESLFDNRPSHCRKLHNMARSVIVLDEVQMLPVPYLRPCLAALQMLSGKYGSSVVLCTATQPALLKSSFLEEGFPPELGGQLARTFLSGSHLPENVYSTVLQRIHADKKVGYFRASLIKAYLCRNKHEEKDMSTLHRDENNIGYRLGRLFALLEKAQKDALGKVNAPLRERYIGAASTTPGRVFPMLLQLSQHHVTRAGKGGSGGYEAWFAKNVGEIVASITKFPAVLSLEDQGRFMLGYYHQTTELYTRKTDTAQAEE